VNVLAGTGLLIFRSAAGPGVASLNQGILMDTHSIEIREGWKKYYLICSLAWLAIMSVGFMLPGQRKESIDFFLHNWSFAKLPFILFFAAIPAICLFYYFDKRVKVRIDAGGIWSRRNGSLAWDDIWYFNSTICKMRGDGDIYKLSVRLKDTEDRLDKSVSFKFRRMDKSFDDIRAVVEYYAGRHGIEDLGHESEV
jgi:hypothetical protein